MTDKITKDMTIGEVVSKHPETVEVMMKHGMHCVGCHVAGMETIEQGAVSHGIVVGELLKKMNAAVQNKNNKKD